MKRVSTTQDQILDASFYVNSPSAETVWEDADNPRFFVVRNGEMRIHAKKEVGDEHTEVIRYTDQLRDFGIYLDSQLAEWTDKGEEVFCWVNNSWFEVWDTKDTNYFSEPLFDLNEAIEYAKDLQGGYGNDRVVE
jgi:hypothetical protein